MRAQQLGESALLLFDAIDSLNVSYAVIGTMARRCTASYEPAWTPTLSRNSL